MKTVERLRQRALGHGRRPRGRCSILRQSFPDGTPIENVRFSTRIRNAVTAVGWKNRRRNSRGFGCNAVGLAGSWTGLGHLLFRETLGPAFMRWCQTLGQKSQPDCGFDNSPLGSWCVLRGARHGSWRVRCIRPRPSNTAARSTKFARSPTLKRLEGSHFRRGHPGKMAFTYSVDLPKSIKMLRSTECRKIWWPG